MREELERRWPKGSIIKVYLQGSQVNPSTMTVIDHDGRGYVRAYMLSCRRFNRRYVRSIYFTNIVGMNDTQAKDQGGKKWQR